MEQVVVNGLYLGAQYALIALGLTLIFSLMNVLNFAHGQMYVLGGFVTYTVVAQFGLPFIVGLLASGIALAAIGALVEKYLFRPVIRNSKREESTMLLAAGIAFFLDAIILLLFGEKQRGLPKIVDGVFNWDFIVVMPYDRILIGLLALTMVAVFILFMQHSKTGRAMRALWAGMNVEIALVDHLQVARQKSHAVRSDAALVGPLQGRGHHRRIAGRHALGLHQLLGELRQGA